MSLGWVIKYQVVTDMPKPHKAIGVDKGSSALANNLGISE